MTSKPPLHGRDHRPGGADPIPGIATGSQAWAYCGAGPSTICDAGAVTILAPATTSFYTNDSTVFDFTQDTILSGHPYGIRFLADGHYRVVANAGPFGTPATGAQYALQEASVGAADSSLYGGLSAVYIASPLPTTDMGQVTLELLQTVGDSSPAPTVPFVVKIQNTGSSNVTMILNAIYVVQLDTTATDII